ncbi:MAG: 3-isopropylmalate dehydrogenase, partial [Magnetospirillum sp.]|nr:3-isopropylmalate dehydrogenase [Magnetospirillum sp.]
MTKNSDTGPFPSAREEAASAQLVTEETPQTASPAYRLAFEDEDFLLRSDLRPVRLQLELLKPEVLQQEQGIRSTIAMFGSARIPDPETAAQHLAEAEAVARAAPRDKVA